MTLAMMAGLAATMQAQQAAPSNPATVAFHFEREGLPVPVFTLTIAQDGSGTYVARYAPPLPDKGARYASGPVAPQPATEVKETFQVSAATTAKLFERMRQTDHLLGGCEAKTKNVANSGAKTLTYAGPDGPATCTFNYSETKPVVWLAETMMAIAETLDQGRTIEQKHLYDRLGLDSAMGTLTDAVHDGRAQEIGAIAPVLQSLYEDPQVLERVRRRAAALLAMSASAR